MARGTERFNLTRQLGGSIGIAVMATRLSHITKAKKALLADHRWPRLPTYSPAWRA